MSGFCRHQAWLGTALGRHRVLWVSLALPCGRGVAGGPRHEALRKHPRTDAMHNHHAPATGSKVKANLLYKVRT